MLRVLLKEDPNDVFSNYALALELVNHENTQTEAEALFQFVLHLNPDYIAAYYQLGKLFESRNNIPQAVHFYNCGLQKARELKNNKAINEFGEAIFMLED